jgi:hypothetical protein
MTLAERKQRLREHSEYVLRLAAMDVVGRRYPGKVTKSALPKENMFWRYLFTPLYRRLPWSWKRAAMRKLKMTAQGWPEEAQGFGDPWHPPAPAGHRGRGLEPPPPAQGVHVEGAER